MTYIVRQRATLLIPYNDVPHLFVVMNDPTPDGECLLGMVSSVRPTRVCDDSCRLQAGDHEFIRHESFVVYRIAEIAFQKRIEVLVEKLYYIPKTDLDPVIFKRVVDGLAASDELPVKLFKFAARVGIF